MPGQWLVKSADKAGEAALPDRAAPHPARVTSTVSAPVTFGDVQVAGLSDSAFRLSISSWLIGAFRLMPLGGIGDWNHLV